MASKKWHNEFQNKTGNILNSAGKIFLISYWLDKTIGNLNASQVVEARFVYVQLYSLHLHSLCCWVKIDHHRMHCRRRFHWTICAMECFNQGYCFCMWSTLNNLLEGFPSDFPNPPRKPLAKFDGQNIFLPAQKVYAASPFTYNVWWTHREKHPLSGRNHRNLSWSECKAHFLLWVGRYKKNDATQIGRNVAYYAPLTNKMMKVR